MVVNLLQEEPMAATMEDLFEAYSEGFPIRNDFNGDIHSRKEETAGSVFHQKQDFKTSSFTLSSEPPNFAIEIDWTILEQEKREPLIKE